MHALNINEMCGHILCIILRKFAVASHYTQQNSHDLSWMAHMLSYPVATASWSNCAVAVKVSWR